MNNRSNLAFSLVESAIVLGVVGLVLGAVWVTATNIMETWRVNRAAEEVLIIARNVQGFLGKATADAIANGTQVSIENAALNAGLIPADLIKNGSIVDPWGRDVSLGLSGGAWGGIISIRFASLNKAACIQVVNRVVNGRTNAETKALGLDNVSFNSANYKYTFPLALSSIPCTEPTPRVEFQFVVNQVNN